MKRPFACAALVVGALLVLTACGGQAGTRDRIRSSEEIANEYNARVAAAYQKGQREIVWPKCDDPKRPAEAPCGFLAEELLSTASIERFRANICGEGPSDPVSDSCVERFRADYLSRVGARYPLADSNATRQQCIALAIDCSKLWAVDIAAMAAHNDAVRARVRSQVDALVAEHRTEQEKRGRQVDAIERARADESAAWGAFAAGLAGAARGMNQGMQSNSPSSPEVAVPAANQCSSDYDCGIGRVCVKSQFQMNGICARAVDRNGVQVYPTPRGNIGPGGPGECMFDTQCPFGFRCVKQNGALSGHCLK